MKESLFIKLNWMVYKKEILRNLPLLSKEDSKALYRKAKNIYKEELKRLPEYGPNDVLKLNLTHGIMLYSIYASCEDKPGVNELREFYHNVVLTPKLARYFLSSRDMTCVKRIKHEMKQAKKSQNARHAYTWQYEITESGDKRFTATFSRCGIYDYFKSKHLPELVPAMCMMDYSFCEVQNHIFLRNETLASGGSVCDCTYISKDIASKEEQQTFEENMRQEAKRGGISLY